jgi:hypothetical protein
MVCAALLLPLSHSLLSFALAVSHSSIVILVSFCHPSLSANTVADFCFHFISDHHSPFDYVLPHSSLIPASCCLLIYMSISLCCTHLTCSSLTCLLSVLLIVICFRFLLQYIGHESFAALCRNKGWLVGVMTSLCRRGNIY